MKINNYLQSQLNKFLNTFHQYRAVFRWLIVDSVLRFKRESFLILITGFLGISFQILTIGVVLYYAKAMEKGASIDLIFYEFDVRNSIVFLFVCGAVILFFLLLAAWLTFFSKTKSLTFRRKYEEFCSKRIFILFGSSFKIWAPFEQDFNNDKIISKLARKDARFCGRALWMLMDLVIPFVTFLVSIGALLYINPFLTFLIFILIGISAVFLYRVSTTAAQNTSLMERFSKPANREYLQVIMRQKTIAVLSPEDESWLENNFFSSGAPKKFLDAYIGRLKTLEYSRLISNILFAAAVFMILLILGEKTIFERQGWEKLIVYLVALRYMITNVRQINTKITSINRFYPQLKRYFQFLESTVSLQNKEKAIQLPKYSLLVSANPPIEGSLDRFDIKEGNRVGIISPVVLNRYTLSFLLGCTLNYSQEEAKFALGSMLFVTSKYKNYPRRSLKESFGFPSFYNSDDLRKDLEQVGLWEKYKVQLTGSFESPVCGEAWECFEPDIKFALAMLNALRSDHQWLVIEEKGLRFLSDAARKFFFDRLSNRIAVIVFNEDLESTGLYQEDVIAVIAQGKVIGLGYIDWFRRNQDVIKDIFNQDKRKFMDKDSSDIDLDDDLDDDDEI